MIKRNCITKLINSINFYNINNEDILFMEHGFSISFQIYS